MIQQVKQLFVMFCCLFIPGVLLGQDCPVKNCAKELLGRRNLEAIQIMGNPPVIDGHLSESIWKETPVADRFVQQSPDSGVESVLKTEARVLFDDHAVYIGMYMYEDPKSIVAPFVRRDDETSCD